MRQEPLALSQDVAAEIERHGLEFLSEMLEIELARRPENLAALQTLGEITARLGRVERSLAIDVELSRLDPRNATVRYNLACSLALSGRTPEALCELELSVELGFADAEHLAADEDLSSLRGEKRFRDLVGLLRARSAAP